MPKGKDKKSNRTAQPKRTQGKSKSTTPKNNRSQDNKRTKGRGKDKAPTTPPRSTASHSQFTPHRRNLMKNMPIPELWERTNILHENNIHQLSRKITSAISAVYYIPIDRPHNNTPDVSIMSSVFREVADEIELYGRTHHIKMANIYSQIVNVQKEISAQQQKTNHNYANKEQAEETLDLFMRYLEVLRNEMGTLLKLAAENDTSIKYDILAKTGLDLENIETNRKTDEQRELIDRFNIDKDTIHGSPDRRTPAATEAADSARKARNANKTSTASLTKVLSGRKQRQQERLTELEDSVADTSKTTHGPNKKGLKRMQEKSRAVAAALAALGDESDGDESEDLFTPTNNRFGKLFDDSSTSSSSSDELEAREFARKKAVISSPSRHTERPAATIQNLERSPGRRNG